MMEYDTLGALVGVLGVLLALSMRLLFNELKNLVLDLEISGGTPSISEDLKQDFYDLIQMALEDTVGSIEMPSAQDHIWGGIMSIVQEKFLGPQLATFNEVLTDSDPHGPKEEPWQED